MKFKHLALAATAACGLLGASNAANAAIEVDYTVANQLYDLDSGVMLEDFDSIDSPFTDFDGNLRGPFASIYNVNDSAPPPYTGPGAITACCQSGNNYSADPTKYASVQMGNISTLTVLGGRTLRSFSFYMGSPDDYNHVTFNLLGGGSETFDGDEIWGGTPQGNGDRTQGFRVYYDFNGAKVTSITFSTENTNAFEFDGLAGVVPEPATWGLMIAGFGAAGAMLRRRRAAIA